jgi:hypothetical protein
MRHQPRVPTMARPRIIASRVTHVVRPLLDQQEALSHRLTAVERPTLPKIGKYSFSPLLPRCPQRYSEFRCVRIKRSHAPLQSARDYRGLCLLAREGLECTNVLFRPIPPLHRFLCHLCSPCNQTCGPISGAYVNKDSSRSRQYGLAAHTEPRVI